uniref:Uncharacterized protein n=1 Tax=Picea glauca TaxID=3330 RepID=A0A124GMZ0_PICGL|nr:hypothetical protein ABT39_MTgene6173 [Picea glauca]QHR88682.1 hypothetical protein Q903MT_gene2696 [Picea sitchensis]
MPVHSSNSNRLQLPDSNLSAALVSCYFDPFSCPCLLLTDALDRCLSPVLALSPVIVTYPFPSALTPTLALDLSCALATTFPQTSHRTTLVPFLLLFRKTIPPKMVYSYFPPNSPPASEAISQPR